MLWAPFMKSPNCASQIGSRLGLAQLIPTSKPGRKLALVVNIRDTYRAQPSHLVNLSLAQILDIPSRPTVCQFQSPFICINLLIERNQALLALLIHKHRVSNLSFLQIY
jgi:hypothetical protein